MVTTPKTSQFYNKVNKLIHKDELINRIQDNIITAVQPALNVFKGNPGSATISWGIGTPLFKAAPGSLYINTAPPSTVTSLVYVNATSSYTTPNWQTIGSNTTIVASTTTGVGTLTFTYTVPTQEWSILQGVAVTTGAGFSTAAIPMNAQNANFSGNTQWGNQYTAEPIAGSVAGLAVSLMNNGATPAGGAGFNGTNLTVYVYKNGTATGAQLVFTTGNTAYVTFTPGQYSFAAGDNIQLWYSLNNSKVPTGVSYVSQVNVTAYSYFSVITGFTVAGTISGNNLVANLTVTGTIYGAGAATLASSLQVNGTTSLTNLVVANGSALTGPVTVAGTLNVTAATVMTTVTTGPLVVTGGASVTGALNVNGAVSLASTFNVVGASVMTTIKTGPATVAGTLNASGDVVFAGNLTLGTAARVADSNLPMQINAPTNGIAFFAANKNGNYGAIFGYDYSAGPSGLATPGGSIRMVTSDPLYFIVNNTTQAGSISSSGVWSLPLGVNVGSAATLASTLSVAGAATIVGNLNVSSTLTCGSQLVIPNNGGPPVIGVTAGALGQMFWDTTNSKLWICTGGTSWKGVVLS